MNAMRTLVLSRGRGTDSVLVEEVAGDDFAGQEARFCDHSRGTGDEYEVILEETQKAPDGVTYWVQTRVSLIIDGHVSV